MLVVLLVEFCDAGAAGGRCGLPPWLLLVTVLVAVGLSGVRLALLLLDGLLLVVLRGGERLGEGEIDIGLSGELISALRFLCGACCSAC